MAQRKKKPSGHQLQTIAQAHHKNEFLRKLKYTINSCVGEDIYSLIPTLILNNLYTLRHHSLLIIPAEGHSVRNEILSNAKRLLVPQIKLDRFVLPQNGSKTTLEDYLTVCLTIRSLFHSIEENQFHNANKIKLALAAFCEDEETYVQFFTYLSSLLQVMGNIESRIGGSLYWFKHEFKGDADFKSGVYNAVIIHKYDAESIHVRINDAVRPVIRLGWPCSQNGIEWVTISPSLLNLQGQSSDKPMKVYIQSHAIHRFTERIDSLHLAVSHSDIFNSFRNPIICCDSHHNLLIEYRISEIKAGYFRIEVVDKIIVVKTFLFLTQSGTPEGDLLGKNTGLNMLDKKYLAIDKLSTFMSSDIDKNEQINKIFSDAGCQSLLELYDKIDQLCTKRSNQSMSMLMLDYLGYVNNPMIEVIPE